MLYNTSYENDHFSNVLTGLHGVPGESVLHLVMVAYKPASDTAVMELPGNLAVKKVKQRRVVPVTLIFCVQVGLHGLNIPHAVLLVEVVFKATLEHA